MPNARGDWNITAINCLCCDTRVRQGIIYAYMQFTTYNGCVSTHALLQTSPIGCQHLVQSLAGEKVIPAIQICMIPPVTIQTRGISFTSSLFLFSKWDISTFHFQSFSGLVMFYYYYKVNIWIKPTKISSNAISNLPFHSCGNTRHLVWSVLQYCCWWIDYETTRRSHHNRS